jgi:hypothetical protein
MKLSPQADGNWCPTDPISHKCRVPTTFPLLLIYCLRISFKKEEVLKGYSESQILMGYQKPYNGPKLDILFDELLEDYASTEDEYDPNRERFSKKIKKEASSVLISKCLKTD